MTSARRVRCLDRVGTGHLLQIIFVLPRSSVSIVLQTGPDPASYTGERSLLLASIASDIAFNLE